MATPVLTAPPPRPSIARTATLWVFRFLALIQAIAFVLQPISIGSFLQGSWAAFDMHSLVGGILVPTTMLTGLVGLLLAVLTRRVWPGIGVIALMVLTMLQVGMGHARLLVVHVPLGVTVVTLAVVLAIWPWTSVSRLAPRGARTSTIGSSR